jgi:hypothetical protein
MNRIKKIRKYYMIGGSYLTDKHVKETIQINLKEINKSPSRTEIINYLISHIDRPVTYLEIGVRNPEDNFNKINANIKYSVDPGIEFKKNPVDFKLSSDDFFHLLRKNEILDSNLKFDVIFIDGLHEANQVSKDITNSLDFIKEDGFIILHDCNPPTEWHSRESYEFNLTPAGKFWNGTTWKAFVDARKNQFLFACCIDSDWGVGIISKSINFGGIPPSKNDYYEFNVFAKNRITDLNLISFESFRNILQKL